jgi:hypothetical protein
VFDGRCAWLSAELDPEVEYMEAFDARADLSPLGLPDSFVAFMSRPELLAAVPSCAACWWQPPGRGGQSSRR